MYPSSIGSSAGHSRSIWNQWSITESVRTPIASAVWARDANVGPMASGPGLGEARHMDVNVHVVLRSLATRVPRVGPLATGQVCRLGGTVGRG